MASAYTELTKEAKRLGGPDGLRTAYILGGVAGYIVLEKVVVGIAGGAGTLRGRSLKKKAARAEAEAARKNAVRNDDQDRGGSDVPTV